jgi:Mrp family chromosome partitioning ATPase/capsular polysaccharide biosynthesis protein
MGWYLSSSEDFRTLTLRDYVHMVWMRAWLVALIVAVCTAAAFVGSNLQTRKYEASARLMYLPPTDVSDPVGSTGATSPDALSIQLQSVIDMIEDPAVRAEASTELSTSERDVEVDVSAGVYVPATGAAAGSTSNLVEITAIAGSPTVAAATANAYATAVIAIRRKWEVDRYEAAQEVLKNQLKLFTTDQSKLTTDYATLVQQLTHLQLAEGTATGDFRVVVPAKVPDAPVSPKPIRSAALGFGVGLIAGIGVAFLAGRLDTRIRSHRQAEDVLGLPALGRLPRIPRPTLRRGSLIAFAEPEGSYSEALRMLRTNLDWASIDDPLSSVMVTSSLKGEGKTLTICNLAVTLARAGKDVILVDADLRAPRVHDVFGLANVNGLTSVALGRVKAADAMQDVSQQPALASRVRPLVTTSDSRLDSGAISDGWTGRLRVLTSGPLPPDPGEFVASRRLAVTMREIEDLAVDYLLVDAPPILSVSDTGTLSNSVHGILMVVNLEKVRRSTLADSRDQLDALPCRKMGMVVVGERIEREEYYRA